MKKIILFLFVCLCIISCSSTNNIDLTNMHLVHSGRSAVIPEFKYYEYRDTIHHVTYLKTVDPKGKVKISKQ